jgi:nucleoside-diphosphate-sugar epimerase
MKVLLTGGLGFIGKNFLKSRPQNWQVTCLDIIKDQKFQENIGQTKFYQVDLSSSAKVKTLAEKITDEFDLCLVFAANGDPALSIVDPLSDLDSTVKTLVNTLTHFKIKKCLYLSSGAVYDGYKGLIGPSKPIIATLPYALTHKLAEDYVCYFQKIGKIESYIIIRFFGAFGPYEPPRKIYTKLVKAFGIARQQEFVVKGDGENLIDAMYVEDTIRGFLKAINSKKTNLLVDFCKGDHPSINQLVDKAAKTFNAKVKIKHEGQVPEYNNFYASNKNFEKLFDFRPEVSLEKGLIKLYEFYQNQP